MASGKPEAAVSAAPDTVGHEGQAPAAEVNMEVGDSGQEWGPGSYVQWGPWGSCSGAIPYAPPVWHWPAWGSYPQYVPGQAAKATSPMCTQAAPDGNQVPGNYEGMDVSNIPLPPASPPPFSSLTPTLPVPPQPAGPAPVGNQEVLDIVARTCQVAGLNESDGELQVALEQPDGGSSESVGESPIGGCGVVPGGPCC